MIMNDFLAKAKMFVKKNDATILTCIGGAGVVATTIMAVKATPKALEKIEVATEEKGEELTKFEKAIVAAPTYIPTALVGIGTLTCIFGANVLNKQHQAALVSAYTVLDSSFKEYKQKVKDIYGEETHQNIVDSIAVEKADPDIVVRGNYLGTNCDLSTEESCSEPVLFYDEYSNRFFEASVEQVMNAEYHLNRNYVLRGYSYLNELYEFLGLEETDYGSVLGWAPNDDGMYWIEFNHRKTTLKDGTVCYILEMPFEPTYDFLDY